jgi:hypothetical protein
MNELVVEVDELWGDNNRQGSNNVVKQEQDEEVVCQDRPRQ